MKTSQQVLQDKFENRTARIAILGMGYVGLPLAVVFAEEPEDENVGEGGPDGDVV